MERDIAAFCEKKEKELLERYFGSGTRQASGNRHETIGEYTKDLPLKIEAEFREFLEEIWKEYSDTPLVLEEQKLRSLITESTRSRIDLAYDDAERITLWEKITGSNHKDVTFYKGLLYEYTKDLLMVMRLDFLEEITGHHITGKAFEE